MKKLLTAPAVLGFILLFVAASASDAGELSFGWVIFMALSGIVCLIFSWTGMRRRKKRGESRKIRDLPLTEKGCAAGRAG